MRDPSRIDTYGRLSAVLLVAGFAVLMSSQVLKPYLAARREIGALREAAQILAPIESDVGRLRAEFGLIQREIAASEGRLPADLSLDAFLGQVGDIGKETRVRLEQLTPHEVRERELFRELRVDVRVAGPFRAIYDFITRLETTGRLSKVERLKMAGTGEQNRYTANLRLTLYFAPGGTS